MSEREYFSFGMSNGIACISWKTMRWKSRRMKNCFDRYGKNWKDVLGDETSDDYKFTIEQLGAKLKWFKKEWRSFDNKIKCGSGLGGKDTKVPKGYDIMNPHFCDAVDDMTSLSVFSFLNTRDGLPSLNLYPSVFCLTEFRLWRVSLF